ncbi:SAM-dependent methyltransferase [Streptomyces sp. H27-D2]|uniref:SAM-dependent methyltransferase n=1 Tax=Streptomyces sp. H27-D2 TaxID=3046304 RepID=UPI002DB767D9|nr:SAM-dependent methyltransferase [Streptomyces sp. H27-D2]MEC4020404.1 SAM-dependent methyltransferase [Streptomyces sp. H27-D2]
MTDSGHAAEQIDTSKPHPARMYDYYLGGKDNYQVDVEAAGAVEAAFPTIKTCARTNRLFMHRATRVLATLGIRQFLDIGTGLPTSPNLHQVAQAAAPESRVVYADYDPSVLVHARALLRSSPEGRTAYIQADVRDPDSILDAAVLHETLDMSRPVALSLNALLHFVPDEDKPYEVVARLVEALPSGSYLVLSHCTPDFAPEMWKNVVEVYHRGGIPAQVRSKEEVLRFFDGLELIEPGVEVPHRWRPDGPAQPGVDDATVSFFVGVARKP